MWQPGWQGSLGENDSMYVYGWLNPLAAHLKLLQHCQLAKIQYDVKRFFQKRIYNIGDIYLIGLSE